MRVKSVPISKVHLDPSNTRLHGARNIEAIRSSLSKYGQVEPLIVRKATGVVIGGNGRLQAMSELGWTQVQIVELDLTETQAASLSIALNRTSDMSSFDAIGLDKMLTALKADGVDVDDELGFNEEDMAALARAASRVESKSAAPHSEDGSDYEPPSPRAPESAEKEQSSDSKVCPACGQAVGTS